jgi:hypothetical protein
MRGEREDSVDYELRMREEQGNAEERDGVFVETEKYNPQDNESVEVPSPESNKENFSDGVQMNEAIKVRQNPSSVEPLSKNTGTFTRTAPDTEVFEPNTGTVSHGADRGDHVLSVNSVDHSHNPLDEHHAFSQKLEEEIVFGNEPAVDNNSSRNEEETRLHNLNENEAMRAEDTRLAETGSQTPVPAFEMGRGRADMSVAGSAESCQFIPYSQPGRPTIDPRISVSGLSIQQYVQSAVQHPIQHTQQSAYQPPHRQANQQPATQVVFGPSQPINPSAQVRMPHQLWDLGGSQGGHSTQPAHVRLSEPDPGFAARYPHPPPNAPSPLTQPQMWNSPPIFPGVAFSAIPGSGGPALGIQHSPQQPHRTGVLGWRSPQPFQLPQPPRAPQKLSAKTEVALKKWENEYFEHVECIRGPATDRAGYQIRQMERSAFGEWVHQRIAECGEVGFMMSLLNMTGRWDLFGHHQAMAQKSTGMKRRLADEEGNEYAGGAAKRSRQH